MRRGLILLVVMTALVSLPAVVAGQSATQGQVTFTKDVAPILYRSCISCHQPGEIAPMSLLTYNDARPWARAIKTKISAREMPPWFIDRTIGIQKFKSDPSLSDAEIATLVKWVDSGAPQGNPADMPPPPKQMDKTAWTIGTPDLIVKYPTFKMPPAGPDLYGALFESFGTKEDRYIKAIQTRVPDQGSRKVVHHALSFAVDPSDRSDSGDDSGGGSGQFLVEYASGKNAEIYPADSGLLLPAGHDAKLSYHLHSIGEPVDAKVELGIVFWPQGVVPKHIRWSKQLGQEAATDLDIPGGSIVRRDGYQRLSKAARITAFQPHAHIRGKYQCLELIYPGQPVRTETVSCANWNYNWHTIYNYEDDVAPIVPAGTLLHVITWYDNSTTNRFNPDPKNWVGAGTGRTIDEMGFAWIGWYDMTDEEYKAELAERKASRQRKTSN
ncbi:MAG TPA: cytochrome c [Vicinamibacterales bacterium]|nr:cytochrome c [Vicinamibacterales bacterium]